MRNLVYSVFLFAFAANAQQSLYFKSGTVRNVQQKIDIEQTVDNELINGSLYRIVVFEEIPNKQLQLKLKDDGIELLHYVPRNTYLAKIEAGAVQLKPEYKIHSILRQTADQKLSLELFNEEYPVWALRDKNEIIINAIHFSAIESETAKSAIASVNGRVLRSNSAGIIRLQINIDQLDALYALPHFFYFEPIAAPEEPENLPGRTDHRSNVLASDYVGGLGYDGTGVTVMMQDDGFIGDHIDYQGRIDQSNCSGCSFSTSNDHGDHVSGTIMGAGNLNPDNKGMAFGADLLVFNSSDDNYDDVPTLYSTEELVVTSKSYSNGCNAGYTSLSAQLDEQTYDLSALIHVFSAGNSGTSDCGYGAGSGWGNLTGGHKAGKNVIAVANLNSIDNINTSSSRGPAEDGRLKPDISAVGTAVVSTLPENEYGSKTGTSMSCPGVSGTITQLYHAFKDLNGGNNPPSGLIKAVVLNTAQDIGNPGPDFIHGWGRINARRAYELLANTNYVIDSVDQGSTNSHSINVPAGVSKLKVMVYWTDVEGNPGASIALVNNLNMMLTDPLAATFDPWVLDHTPNAVALNEDALRKKDSLNNMEQVTLDNPTAGIHTIDVEGFNVPFGPQTYYLVYEFVQDKIVVTYPQGGESFTPGTSEYIRWDASDGITDFSIDFSADDGVTWTNIGSALPNDYYFYWPVPDTLSGESKIRVTRGAQDSQSAAPFSIMREPQNLSFNWSCPDSLNFSWDSVPGATSYTVYMLGNKYMDSIGTSTDTNFTILATSTVENWFSVRAHGPNNVRSERAIAVRKLPGQFGCLWSDPIPLVSVECDSVSSAQCIQVLNQSQNVDQTATYLWYFPNGTPSTSTDENPTVCYSGSGYQNVALVVTNGAGTDSSYFYNYVYVQPALPLPYYESFETLNTFNGQDNWSVFNPDVNSTFVVTSIASLTGNKSTMLYNHGQSEGSIDELISGPIDLTSLDPATDIMTFSFRYAHRHRDAAGDDWLRLYVKDACDNPWALRKTLHGSFLSNTYSSPPWSPSNQNDWVTVHVTNITPSYFTGDFRFKFNFENGNGNNLYIDDINIYSGAPSDDVVIGLKEIDADFTFEVFPNPAEDDLNVNFILHENVELHIDLEDMNGRTVQSHLVNGAAGKNLVMIDTEKLTPGVYYVHISTDGMNRIKKVIIQ